MAQEEQLDRAAFFVRAVRDESGLGADVRRLARNMDTNLPVYISGDRDTLHGAMADVYEVVRSAGIQKVAFMVGGKEEQTAR